MSEENINIATKEYVDYCDESKQDLLQFDTTPVSGGMNPVTSDGIFNAIQSNKFDGNLPDDNLEVGTPDR